MANVERFIARALNANDVTAFRAIRLEALQNESDFFGHLYQEENQLTAAQWRQRCTETYDSCFFGLFDQDQLIGIMSAKKWDEDKEGRTVLWGSTYLKSEYRGRKIAEKLYKVRLEWTKRNPNQFRRAVFFIHEENIRSREIHEKQGAKYMFTKSMQWWASGPIALWHWYEKKL